MAKIKSAPLHNYKNDSYLISFDSFPIKIIALGLVLLLCLLGSMTTPAVAAADEAEWSEVNLPTEGEPGGWVLAEDADILHLTRDIKGKLYAGADVDGADTLFKSEDEGHSWTETGYTGGAITDIVCSSINTDVIYVTDSSHVYKSEDAGESFRTVADATLPALDVGEAITCLDVGYVEGKPYLFIGTADADGGDFGGTYYLTEASLGARWTDLEIGSQDVYSIAVSPTFADDSQIIAVVTDEARTIVVESHGAAGAWQQMAELLDASGGSFDIVSASNICFPADYEDELFVGVAGDTVTGGVYRVNPGDSYRFAVDADISSLDLIGKTGNARLMAGAQDASTVYYSPDDGESWETPEKPPAGDGATHVLMARDFAASGQAYATTGGTDSAFSYTADYGASWNQLSLIDTTIQVILELAPSPVYDEDGTLFLLTWGGETSLWRSLDSGTNWERVFTTSLPNVDSLNKVALSPQYGENSQLIFLAGTSGGNPALWKSKDNGENFTRRPAPSTIDTWVIVDDTTFFFGSYDGSHGRLYHTSNSGMSYSEGTEVGDDPLNSIAISPNHAADETILMGNSSGWVYWSDDGGDSFEPLPGDATSAPFTGAVAIAFDPEFADNDTVYAASDTADEGIFRFTIGSSDEWENIDSPAGGMMKQVVLSEAGVLYATNSDADGGIERCLDPTYSLGPTFETVTQGLDNGATLAKLWLVDNRLWSIDSTNVKLVTLVDSLTQPVTLISPANRAPGAGAVINDVVKDVKLDWRPLSGATSYHWQLDDDTNFSSVLFEDDSESSYVRLPDLEPATTYYWRVRATEPVLSPWSAKWSFTTSLGAEVVAPRLLYPEAGASNAPLKPVLQWSAIAGAEGYEIIISTDAALANPTILKMGDYALPGTAWECNVSLSANTTYYWKVRAVNGDTRSEWSAVSAFKTAPAPEETVTPPQPPALVQPPPPPPPTPAPIPPETPDWVKYLIGALILTIILLLVTMLALVVVMKRP